MAQPSDVKEREYSKFVDSPSRANESAVEVIAQFGSANGPFEVDQVESETVNKYDEALAVLSGVETLVSQYTVPVGKRLRLAFCEVSGSNIGTFSVKHEGSVVAKGRTWFNSPMGVKFSFTSNKGRFEALAGEIISVHAYHERPDAGDFEARIFGELLDA